MKLKSVFLSLLAFCLLCCFCYSANIAYIVGYPDESGKEPLIKAACKFYGIEIKCLDLREFKNDIYLADNFGQIDFHAIVISARALSVLYKKDLLSILKNLQKKSVPLLILGVSSDIESSLLSELSHGAIGKCTNFNGVPMRGFYRVSNLNDISRQLTGLEIPLVCKNMGYFLLGESRKVEQIIHIVSENKGILFPIFVKTMVDGQEMFFLAQNQLTKSSTILRSEYKLEPMLGNKSGRQYDEYILQILPLMMFLRYACGDRCWHSTDHYANLTIDDPWLTEPYGHLSYVKLLEEMVKANFHTAIAFIPWNYDRSEPDVVSCFHDNPDRFSICIHGNNHDHQEFYKYETKPGDPWPAKPMHVQEENIKQALARMEKFKNLTGLFYDKVLVFPHAIAPAKTLGLLKKYNFMATVNAVNVPLGSEELADTLYRLRPITMQFENFPSLKRHIPDRSQPDIAIDLFLDNPLLFYAHHDFFEDGIDSFNKTVNVVNNIQPDIIWQSVGYIVQHLYLKKLRDDGNYDVMSFSSNFILENQHQSDLNHFVRKEELSPSLIKHVMVNNQPYSYKITGSDLMLEVDIPARESRHIVIEYENDLDLSCIDLSKNNPRINRLRKLSDFRDLTLSKNVIGRTFSHFYYDTGLYKLGLMRLAILIIVLAILTTFGIWYFKRHRKRQNKF